MIAVRLLRTARSLDRTPARAAIRPRVSSPASRSPSIAACSAIVAVLARRSAASGRGVSIWISAVETAEWRSGDANGPTGR